MNKQGTRFILELRVINPAPNPSAGDRIGHLHLEMQQLSTAGLTAGLTNCGDGVRVRDQTPGVGREEATTMKDARSKANVLLKLLLDPSAPAALLEDHLLVHLVLAK